MPKESNAPRRGWRRFLRALVGIALTLVVLEAALLLLIFYFQNYYGIGQRFIREDSLKIAFVGDSFTAGARSPANYVDFAQEFLDETAGEGAVEMCNLAQSGTPSNVHLKRLRRYYERADVKPDILVIVSGHNDMSNPNMRKMFLDQQKGRLGDDDDPYSGWIYSSNLSLLAYSLFIMKGDNFISRRVEPTYVNAEFYGWAARVLLNGQLSMIDTARESGTSVMFGSYLDIEPHVTEIAAQLSDKLDLERFDFGDVGLRRVFENNDLYIEDGWHMNESGHRLMGLIWADYIAHGYLGCAGMESLLDERRTVSLLPEDVRRHLASQAMNAGVQRETVRMSYNTGSNAKAVK